MGCANIKKENQEMKEQISKIYTEKATLERTINDNENCESSQLEEKIKEIKELKLDLKIEKREVEKKSDLLKYVREREHKTNDKVRELESKVGELEKNLEELNKEKEELLHHKTAAEEAKEKVKSLRADMEKIKKEKLDISMEK